MTRASWCAERAEAEAGMWGLELGPRRDVLHGSLEWSAQGTDGRNHSEGEEDSLYTDPSIFEVAVCVWLKLKLRLCR